MSMLPTLTFSGINKILRTKLLILFLMMTIKQMFMLRLYTKQSNAITSRIAKLDL